MKSKPKSSDEYAAFINALKKVLSVTHSELKNDLDAEKQKRKVSGDRASGAKD